MGWFILVQLFSTLISMVRLGRVTDSEKDLEILLLRHQLDILERKQKRLVRPNRVEKLILAVLATHLKQATNRPAGRLRDVIRIFQPETVLSIESWSAASGRSREKRKEVARASARNLKP